MYAKTKKPLLLLAIGVALGTTAKAQSLNDQSGPKSNKENAPFSRFGIGDLSNPYNAILRGSGGIGTAYSDPFSINSFNPASYGYLKVSTLEFALEARSRSLSLANYSTSSGTGTLSYFALAIPMGKYAGMSMGLQPVSNIYYNANDTINDPSLGKGLINYNGSGGLQYAYLGLAGTIEGFSLGFNAGYMFGSARYSTTYEGLDNTPIRNADFTQSNYIKGFYWKGGAMYRASLKKERYINIGATVKLSQDLQVKRDNMEIGYQFLSDGSIIRDTVEQTKLLGAKGTLKMPAEYSFGVHYGKDYHWNFGADFIYSDWSQYEFWGDRRNIASSAWRAAIGAEITPNGFSQKIVSATTYRAGLYYAKDYIETGGKDLIDVGGSVGASIPLKRNMSQFGRVNLALNIGQRGNINDNQVREFYTRFTVGVSLNEIWFRKHKFE